MNIRHKGSICNNNLDGCPIFRYGCNHEKDARTSFALIQRQQHEDFCIKDAGFFVSTNIPYIGATPDGIVSCKCCGKGIIEIKCPFCLKDKSLDQIGSGFCLDKADNGQFFLKRDHQYYYQIQMQLNVTQVKYCDFVVWTNNSFNSTFLERIFRDDDFFKTSITTARIFYVNAILPELLGKSYTVERARDNTEDTSELLCYCRERSDGEMLECKSGICSVKLFHRKCLGFSRDRKVPKTWKCPNCTKVINKEKRDKKKASK